MEQIHINNKGVLILLNNFNPHKACGPDNVNNRVMKDLKDQVAPILTKIYTKSIEIGSIPKTGNTQMLHQHSKRANDIKQKITDQYH